MKVAAIIAEYNPFHKGHLYQLNKVREILGEDTAIVAIMSGNFTQRGEVAVVDKTVRARAAVDSGVNLVLEIPFPHSMSSAEFYAKAGVHIANSLGVVDYLVFGSECGDIEMLSRVAKNTSSPEFVSAVTELCSKDGRDIGYPAACQKAYAELYGDADVDVLLTPNNILAIEYVKAIQDLGSSIVPVTIKREGAGYNDSIDEKCEYQSASAIREIMRNDFISALDYIPEFTKDAFSSAHTNGKMPTDEGRLDAAVISFFRLNSPEAPEDIHDATGGLYNRLQDASSDVLTIFALIKNSETKKYTNARIRRAVWYSYFGVTSSEVRTLPGYTQILALDGTGRKLLKVIKKVTDFPVITKPSDYSCLSEVAKSQKEKCQRADGVFMLTEPVPSSGRFPLTFTPYVKK